jgi:hypothetical protein
MAVARQRGAGWMIELAHRQSGSLHVGLFWCKADATLKVEVVDVCTDDAFELEATEASALDVFYHPYAYEAIRRAGEDLVARSRD